MPSPYLQRAPDPESCRFVHMLAKENQCAFVKSHDDCHMGDSFIDYVPFIYCNFNDSEWQFRGGIAFLFLMMIVTFVVLSTTADSFFCPALAAIATWLGLSESVAGVTVLAFGNGSPDIFTSIAAAPSGRVGMILAELLGGGIFVTTVTSGFVLLCTPFKMYGPAFLRDSIFYLLSVIWLYVIFLDGYLTYYETTAMIIIYAVYLAVVLIGNYIQAYRMKKGKTNQVRFFMERIEGSRHSQLEQRDTYDALPPPTRQRKQSIGGLNVMDVALKAERRSVISRMGLKDQIEHQKHTETKRENKTDEKTVPPTMTKRPTTLFKDFVYEIIPIDVEEWHIFPWYWKFTAVIKAPAVFVLKFCCPVVNDTAERNGWCKLLNTLHCLVVPLLVCFIIGGGNKLIAGVFPLWALLLIIGALASCLVFFTSEVNKAPRYHMIFAFLGFVSAMIIVFRIAGEVVNILHCAGVIFRISEATIGLSILAWGNSIGDLISNTAIARAGFPRMGFAACFGGPLFNMLFGCGISLTMAVATEETKTGQVPFGSHTLNCIIFHLFGLTSSIIAFPLMMFEARRSFGIFLLCLYAMFIIFSVLCEIGITHPFGTYQDNQ